MSKYKLLFNYLKTLLPSEYRVTFGTQEEGKENTIGAFFQGGKPRKKIVSSGEYLEDVVSVTLNIHSKKDYKSVEKCIEDLEKFVQEFNKVHDYTYSEGDSSVSILYTELFGNINQLGFNGVGIPCFSINYVIYYK